MVLADPAYSKADAAVLIHAKACKRNGPGTGARQSRFKERVS
jgi:hypothetical protein